MSENEQNYFDLGSGLPLDGADVVITDAWFEFDTSYNADTVVCKVEYTLLNENAEPQIQMYSTGKDREPIGQGHPNNLAHTSGKFVKISDQSNYGTFIKGFMACENHEAAMKVASERGLQPDSSALWIGMKFTMRSVSRPNTMEGAKRDTTTTMVPAVFLGVDGDAVAGSGARPATRATNAMPATATVGDIDAYLMEQLNALAVSVPDFDTFMEQAMEIDGVAGNKIAEKAVMSSKAGSIWKTNNP